MGSPKEPHESIETQNRFRIGQEVLGRPGQDRDSGSVSNREPLYPHREDRETVVVGGLHTEGRSHSNHFSQNVKEAGDETL